MLSQGDTSVSASHSPAVRFEGDAPSSLPSSPILESATTPVAQGPSAHAPAGLAGMDATSAAYASADEERLPLQQAVDA